MSAGRFYLLAVVLWAVILTAGQPRILWAAENDLAAQISDLSAKYETMIEVAARDQSLGLSLGQAGRTWAAAARHLARRHNISQVEAFLAQAENQYQQQVTQNLDQPVVQLAGFEFLYRAAGALAFVLATINQNEKSLANIRETEKRVVTVVRETGGQAAPLAPLAGGIMSMLTIAASEVDISGAMTETRNNEIERRRAVSSNISGLETNSEHKILLLTNNYLFGALSMVEIMGLSIDQDLSPRLSGIEEELVKLKDEDVETLILAGAQALTEAGFLVAPALDKFKPRSQTPEIKDPKDGS